MVRGWLVRKQVAVTIQRLRTLVLIGARRAAQRTEIVFLDDSKVFSSLVYNESFIYCLLNRNFKLLFVYSY